MSETKILSVEATTVPDQLLVKGQVGDEDVQVTVWHSHLYGEQPLADAREPKGKKYHVRAPEHESNPGPRDPQVPQTDGQRKAYLREQLEAAANHGDSGGAYQRLADE